MMTVFIYVILGVVVFQVVVQLILNRGKINWLNLAFLVGYGLAVAIPIVYASMFRRETNLSLYLIILICIQGPFILFSLYQVFKGREPLLWVLSIIAGLFLISSSPFVPIEYMIIPVGSGIILLTVYLYFHLKFPYLNPMWLSSLALDVSKRVEKGGRYSSKPVSININTGKIYTTGTNGFNLVIKKDKVIMRLSRKLHKNLGSPNMELFAQEIAQEIWEKSHES